MQDHLEIIGILQLGLYVPLAQWTKQGWNIFLLKQVAGCHLAMERARAFAHKVSCQKESLNGVYFLEPHSGRLASEAVLLSGRSRQESNLRTWFRRPVLYPLSYGNILVVIIL